MQQSIISIDNLSIRFGERTVVDKLSIDIRKGETLGIVGESGSGKSLSALSILQLLPAAANIHTGRIMLAKDGQDAINLLTLSNNAIRKIRGKEIGMIFQEPMSALNPVIPCGQQISETLAIHQKISAQEAREKTLAWLERVQISDPKRVYDAYPHQISGGQKQRVLIAAAMIGNPQCLIADEPTTALDLTVQKALIDLLVSLRDEFQLSMLFISHDLGVIANLCERAVVMQAGRILESGNTRALLHSPKHPYTRGLVAARPSIHQRLYRLPTLQDFLTGQTKPIPEVKKSDKIVPENPKVLLRVEEVNHTYLKRNNWLSKSNYKINALVQCNFSLYAGQSLGIAGESGCGKTTLAKVICGLIRPDSGHVWYKGIDLCPLEAHAWRPFRKEIQIIFQDPYSALNPRIPLGEVLAEPILWHGLAANRKEAREKAVALLESVGLQADHMRRYPHAFSGGQRQRIGIARALAVEPTLLICDEIVSSLDTSVQASILNLLSELQEKKGLTYLFISHDLAVIRQMCESLIIMQAGRIVDQGPTDRVFTERSHPYTRQLIDAVLSI